MKEKLVALIEYMENKPELDSRAKSMLMDIQADLEANVEVPDDIMSVFPQELRQALLMFFIAMTAQA